MVPGTKCEEPIVFVEIIFIIPLLRRRHIFEGLSILENPWKSVYKSDLAKIAKVHSDCTRAVPAGSIAPPNARLDLEKGLLIKTKFGGVIDLTLKNIYKYFENFSPNRKSAILDGVQEFQFYDHTFEAFRMH